MGKRLVKNESDIQMNLPLPGDYSCLDAPKKNLESICMSVRCWNGEHWLYCVRGKMKEKSWISEGARVSPWNFQGDEKRGIIFSYTC